MPWQQLVADVGSELITVDGLVVPAYRDVVVTVPRQSGKTMLLLSWKIQRAHGWGRPQTIAYSAQTGNDARKKLIEDWVPLLEPRKAKLGIRRLLKGMGNEGIEFRGGSRVVFLANTADAGHGKTIALGVKDELFADTDFRRDQALVPAMATIDDAQVLTASTAGTDASVPLNAAVRRGRQAVLEDRREGIAYFEWSADEDDDLDDPESWWSFMPALGHTQSIRSIMAARETLADKPGEFRRAFGNIATKSDERVIPAVAWDAVCGSHAPDSSVAVAIDVNPERSMSSIAVSDGSTVELVEHGLGTGWLVDRTVEIAQRWKARVGLDPAGPVGSFREELERRRVMVVDCSGRDLVQACGGFYDAVVEGQVKVRHHHDLDVAVAGALKRQLGDAWAWDRKNPSVDISPLVAVTIARWAAQARGSLVFAY